MADASGTQAEETERAPGEPRSRRTLLIGAGLAGVAGLAAACGGSGDGGGSGGADGGAEPGTGGGAGGGALAAAGEIPVGGGKVFEDAEVVVCQPQQGQFTAFSAACTHRGCSVGSVSGGTINCPCHGSKFDIKDGSVVNPPADEPLKARKVTVEGGKIMLA
ncbi:Ferredoxin subunit of nitrite reductase or a ring-hydroxylating dioxygenase [Actinomadura meyerae]|jgi:nitrite reductase/ring-hydroxylating ferredoxin subunit|uniref:Cytochrome bc1 complex Rieske iron-sulfur subunit n=1 Tax=Actinomadura meyerae TaxID=240840 RepID=A0A239GNH5_9ACTN|nr:Rieske (2Fe-2S) protein [Actinomadura meyerae]SNS69624.1 Ferredoxin subunit of nitrite reductase or a ring-hydroxylating dioxygenase [Actinomadura meyerae]